MHGEGSEGVREKLDFVPVIIIYNSIGSLKSRFQFGQNIPNGKKFVLCIRPGTSASPL